MTVSFPPYPPPPSDIAPGAVVSTGLVGAMVGVGAAWWVVYPAGWALEADSVPAALMVNLVAAATVVAGLLLALRVRFAGVARVRRALPRIARWVMIAGVVAIAPTALVAGASGYSWSVMVLALEFGVVAVLVGAAVAAAHALTPSPLR